MNDALVCPACTREYPSGERFCADCGTPLVYAQAGDQGRQQLTAQQRRARKIKPQYTEGRLVKAAYAHNQTEAEFIQGLLLEEGVPCMLRRSAGFDVPDFLAVGPRDVLVPESGAAIAREVLLYDQRYGFRSGRGAWTTGRWSSSVDARRRAMAWVLLSLLALFVLFSILTHL
jgi:hypothetical protein